MLDLIKKTIEEIKQHPYIVVTEEQINPPASEDLFDLVKFQSVCDIPSAVKDFYKQANGVVCRWSIKPDLDEKIMTSIYQQELEPGYDYTKPLGAIHILPIEKVMVNAWQGPQETDPGGDKELEFSGQKFTYGSFGKLLKPFDLFSDIQCMTFVLLRETNEYKVMMMDDYYADWQNSLLTDFTTYLSAICAMKFMIPARAKIFKQYRGDLKPAVTWDKLKNQLPELPMFEPKFFNK